MNPQYPGPSDARIRSVPARLSFSWPPAQKPQQPCFGTQRRMEAERKRILGTVQSFFGLNEDDLPRATWS